MTARETIFLNVQELKNKNDQAINELFVKRAGNEEVIATHIQFEKTLQENLGKMKESNMQSQNGTKSHHSHLHSTQTQGDDETRSLEEEKNSIVNENSKKMLELNKALEARKKIQEKVNALQTQLATLHSALEKKKKDWIDKRQKKTAELTNVKNCLVKIENDFSVESSDVNKIDDLLKKFPDQPQNRVDIAKYKAVVPFNVTPGAFMVGGQENHGSNNGFHELSARIANLARQINRVTAV